MSRNSVAAVRVPVIAATAIAVLVASMTASTVAAAKAPSGASNHLAAGVKVPAHSLKGALVAQQAKPRILGGKPGSANTEPGKSLPVGVPSSGKYAFLLKLGATSTTAAYRTAAPHGTAAASAAAKSQLSQVKAAQAHVVAALPSGSTVLYRIHSVLAGVAVYTDVHNFAALQAISGVQAVYPIAPKTASNSYAVPLVGAPAAWTAHADRGEHSTIAIIDTGIDYTHANLGGPGSAAVYTAAKAADGGPPDPALFPNSKVVGGTDLVGDAYDPADPANATPVPDPNPLDCNGHGSHVSGTSAGYGVTSAGVTYPGPYDTTTPFNALRIGPGMAPQAKLLAYKVFGCEGSTNVVAEAIDMASDPNGDGDPSDHAKVINMSLGADYASPQDGDSVASNNASDLGISVVVASGNGGDFYDIGGSPGDAVKTIAVANSVDAYNQIDTLHVSAPTVAAYGAERSVAFDYSAGDLAGTVAVKLSAANEDGCDPLSAADAALVVGKIAFLEWTDNDSVRRCGSVTRSGNVAKAGATGFIFADDAETFAAGITGSTVIPGVLVIKSAGDAIRAQLATGVVVSGTTANDFRQVVPGNDDLVNSSSSRGVRGAGNVKPDVTAVGTSVFSTAVGTGNQGVSFTGTSMATPMVAGLSALVRSEHPDWTPEEVKADIMNTAGTDLTTGQNHTGTKYAPNRVGAGRIQADSALDNTTLAYVQDDPGAVSVSFGPVAVTAPLTMSKTLKVVNKDLARVTYDVSYQALTSVPGVSYTVSPASVTIDPLSTKTVTVSLVIANPSLLTKTLDPTMSRVQGTAGLPREFLADASGRVLLASANKPTLRVPVYSAPRPASVMTQPASLTMPNGTVQQGFLPLSGRPVNQGAGNSAIQSTVAGFALEATSGLAPSCSATITEGCVHFADERSADLKYVGATTSAPQVTSIGGDPIADGLTYFSITTQGPWRTAASTQEFDILIDTNGDNQPDAVLFNTRFGAQDIFVSELVDLNSGAVLDTEGINDRLGDTDTALMDSDTMVLPVATAALPGVSAANPRIHYGVESFSNDASAAVDSVGAAGGVLSHPLTIDVRRPAISVFGTFDGTASPLLFSDTPGAVLAVRRDAPAAGIDHPLGVLVVHLHNTVGTKAQVMALKSASTVSLKLAPTTARARTAVTATMTVTNSAGTPATGKISLRHVGGSVYATGVLVNGVATVRFVQPTAGTFQFRAEYGGDANYLPGNSAVVTLHVI